MIRHLRDALEQNRLYVGRRPAEPIAPAMRGPDWVQAHPDWIDRALQRALKRPSGGWYALDAAGAIDDGTPRAYDVAGRRLVLWRSDDRLLAAPEACPHMGAPLAEARADGDVLICPWHGLRLGPKGHADWQHLPTFDDGVLAWVRLDEGGQESTEAPFLPARPARYIDSVVRMEAACAPEDVLANRLDPWHGAHFHPHSFAHLTVFHADEDALKLRVAFRIAGPVCIEVDATFHCPDPRTICMTITDGDGVGSVVETHATPLEAGRSAILEVTLATSDRRGFDKAVRMAPLFRPLMRRAAERLWVEDAAYAERRAWLRRRGRA